MRPIDDYIMKVPIEINQIYDVKNVPRKYFTCYASDKTGLLWSTNKL